MRLALLRCASDMTMAARPCGAWTGARVAARRRRAGRLRRRAVAGRLRRDGLDPLDDLGEALASLIASPLAVEALELDQGLVGVGGGDPRDGVAADLGAVELRQVVTDVADGHPAAVEAKDLVVQASAGRRARGYRRGPEPVARALIRPVGTNRRWLR